jgi:hypothetical protein
MIKPSRLITLNDLIREKDEKKIMNHQRTFGSSAQRRTKEEEKSEYVIPFVLVREVREVRGYFFFFLRGWLSVFLA